MAWLPLVPQASLTSALSDSLYPQLYSLIAHWDVTLFRYPDLAGYSNYLENVLKNISTGMTYYDGINEDYNFLTTSQANASCLTESATSYQVSKAARHLR